MKCEVRINDNDTNRRRNHSIEDWIPVCGEDFCERCGDCLSCYCGNGCWHNNEGDHLWIQYFDTVEDFKAFKKIQEEK